MKEKKKLTIKTYMVVGVEFEIECYSANQALSMVKGIEKESDLFTMPNLEPTRKLFLFRVSNSNE